MKNKRLKVKSILSHKTLLGLVAFAMITISISCEKETCDLSNPVTSTVTDIEGHVYPTVIFEGQQWMAENLNTSLFANGDSIEQVITDSLWQVTSNAGYAYYNNDSTRQESLSYGKLYNFNAITDSRNMCPQGWHVSTKSDWDDLVQCMNGESRAGIALKDTVVWNAPNQELATNESQFTALPQGARTEIGEFTNQRFFAYFWGVDDDPRIFSMSYISEGVGNFEVDKRFGGSVRCVKD
ncbi:MAG: hypothetical protein ACJAZ2_002035 [Glaciecola sp.]